MAFYAVLRKASVPAVRAFPDGIQIIGRKSGVFKKLSLSGGKLAEHVPQLIKGVIIA